MSDAAEPRASSERFLDLSEPDYSRLTIFAQITIALEVIHMPNYRMAKLYADEMARETIRYMDKQAAIRAERAAWRRDHPTRLTRIGRAVWSVLGRLFGCNAKRSDSQPSSPQAADIELAVRDEGAQPNASRASKPATPDVEHFPEQSVLSARAEIV